MIIKLVNNNIFIDKKIFTIIDKHIKTFVLIRDNYIIYNGKKLLCEKKTHTTLKIETYGNIWMCSHGKVVITEYIYNNMPIILYISTSYNQMLLLETLVNNPSIYHVNNYLNHNIKTYASYIQRKFKIKPLISIKNTFTTLFCYPKFVGISCIISTLPKFGIYIHNLNMKLLYSDTSYKPKKFNIFMCINKSDKYYIFDIITQYKTINNFISQASTFINDYNNKNFQMIPYEIGTYKQCTCNILQKHNILDVNLYDGIVYMNNKNKFRWKPVTTINFYTVIKNNYMYLYVGATILTINKIRNDGGLECWNEDADIEIGSQNYRCMLFTYQQFKLKTFLKYDNHVVKYIIQYGKYIPIQIHSDKILTQAHNYFTVLNNIKLNNNIIKLEDLLK